MFKHMLPSFKDKVPERVGWLELNCDFCLGEKYPYFQSGLCLSKLEADGFSKYLAFLGNYCHFILSAPFLVNARLFQGLELILHHEVTFRSCFYWSNRFKRNIFLYSKCIFPSLGLFFMVKQEMMMCGVNLAPLRLEDLPGFKDLSLRNV